MKATLCLVAGLLWIHSSPADAWALKKELRQAAARRVCLTTRALSQGYLRYSIRVDNPARFPLEDMAAELERALEPWLGAFPGTRVERVSWPQNADLRIELGPKPRGDNSQGAFTASAPDYVLIHLNTDHVWHETRGQPENANGDYAWQPFRALAGPAESLDSLIRQTRPLTVSSFARQRALPHSTAFWTTYRCFVHELGHAFGLADTNELVEQQSEPSLRSHLQPNSVMKTSEYFAPTSDDLTGLRESIQLIRAYGT